MLPSQTQSRGRPRRRKGGRKHASGTTGTRALENQRENISRQGEPAGAWRKRERVKEKKPTPTLLGSALARERAGSPGCSSWKSLCRLASALSRRPPGRRQRRGGGGLGEWVTSRGRRQAVWAAEPMNQLSGERAPRAGGGCWNAPGAARPGRGRRCARPRPAPPVPGRPARSWQGGAGAPGSSRRGCGRAPRPPNSLRIPPPA